MRTLKSSLYSLLIIVIVFSSCKKEEDTPVKPAVQNIYHSLDTSLTHYKFKPGTYWVYRNDSTSSLDSIIIDSVESDFIVTVPGVHGGSSILSEFYKKKMHDFTSSQYFNDYLIGIGIIRNGNLYDWQMHGTCLCLTNSDTGSTSGPMKIIAKFPSMLINSNTFGNVVESKITAALQTEQDFAHDTYLFYSQSAGLIKKEEDLGGGNIQSWSLLRWHVVR